MARIKFRNRQQRKFLQLILQRINSPSLRELRNRGIEIPYSTLKNYFSEDSLMPENLFFELCQLANISPSLFSVKKLSESWGQIIGGKKSRKLKKLI